MPKTRYYSGVKSEKTEAADTAVTATSATSATKATNVAGGIAYQIPYQTNTNATSFLAAPSTTYGIAPYGQILQTIYDSTVYGAKITWGSIPTLNLAPTTVGFVTTTYGYSSLSSDGLTWTAQTTGPGVNTYRIGYGKGLFVAAEGYNTSGYYAGVSSSTDGITWNVISPYLGTGVGNAVIQSVAYGNGLFILPFASTPGYNYGYVGTFDGTGWSLSATGMSISSMATAYGNGTYVILCNNNLNYGASSTDGYTWTQRATPAALWTDVAYGNGVFAAISSSQTAASSTDGITWTARTMPSNISWTAIAYGNGVFVALSSGSTSAASSTDGVTWTARTLPNAFNGYQVAYGAGNGIIPGCFMAMDNTTGNYIRSTDGITWTVVTGQPSTIALGMAYAPAILTPRTLNGELQEVITRTNYTVSNYDKWINFASTGIVTVTLPTPLTNKNREIVIKQTAPYAVNSASANVKPLTSQTAGTAILSGAGKYAKLVSNGNHWVIMEAN